MKTLAALLSIFFFTSSIAQTDAGNAPTLSSTITQDEDLILIEWETKQEVNTSYFTIESSLDGVTYEVISSVNASGYAINDSNYDVEIDAPQNGAKLRIALVNMEGKRIAFSEIFDLSNEKLVVSGE